MCATALSKIEVLYNRLEDNYSAFLAVWNGKAADELIDMSEEITATRSVYAELAAALIPPTNGKLSADDINWLLRFKNPLEIVRDAWLDRYFEHSVLQSGLSQLVHGFVYKEDALVDYTS